ncbi:HD-GYP domain-containing protein [Paenibacillus psychroresistens]|uniref:HD-GYP domain-containing protein n=1 Tax=Paenibacillus psychroresistens TaxID=1778678 RepID=A0A6B8RC31_9BACL|nr:HD-GYP domain-containing protein [Paenibacillus psychroresistens]QGQ93454.1 HD-GYP domain-containing protein [Paenibacillus psychroresistens]
MVKNQHKDLKHLVGCRLKKDIYSNKGVLVLSEAMILTDEHIHQSILHGVGLSISDIVMEDDKNMDLVIDEALDQVKSIFRNVRHTNRIPLIDIRRKLIPAINKITENSGLFGLLNDLQAKDDYTYYHNIGVSIIATMIGKWMQLSPQELSILSVAAFLHDIGKLMVPKEILNKAGKLTEDEFEIMKKHTIYGYEIINNTIGCTHRHALIALQHHEREDGSGYPLGLKGDKVDILSKIVAVADVFHAMTSKRVYHDAIPFHQVLQKMQKNAFGKLDPTITTLFMEKIMSTTIGNETVLTDGRRAKIVMINPSNRMNPLVKINSDFVDLSQHHNLNLAQVLG